MFVIDLEIEFILRKTPLYNNINVSFFISKFDLITIFLTIGYVIYLFHKFLYFPLLYIFRARKKNKVEVRF